MLRDVDSRSLERYDRALVGFGTRHTLSVQDDPERGIGAARDYIKAQFEKIATTADGRMTVELQSYVQEPASRIDAPTKITNVVAKDAGMNIQGVLNMDIVGSSVGGNGLRDPRTIRLFSEGIPTSQPKLSSRQQASASPSRSRT